MVHLGTIKEWGVPEPILRRENIFSFSLEVNIRLLALELKTVSIWSNVWCRDTNSSCKYTEGASELGLSKTVSPGNSRRVLLFLTGSWWGSLLPFRWGSYGLQLWLSLSQLWNLQTKLLSQLLSVCNKPFMVCSTSINTSIHRPSMLATRPFYIRSSNVRNCWSWHPPPYKFLFIQMS